MNVKLIPTILTPVNGELVPTKIEEPGSTFKFRLLDEDRLEEIQVTKDDFQRLIKTDKLTALRELMTLFRSENARALFAKAIVDRGCIEFNDTVLDLSPLTEEGTDAGLPGT